jgi:hypothetical protein
MKCFVIAWRLLAISGALQNTGTVLKWIDEFHLSESLGSKENMHKQISAESANENYMLFIVCLNIVLGYITLHRPFTTSDLKHIYSLCFSICAACSIYRIILDLVALMLEDGAKWLNDSRFSILWFLATFSNANNFHLFPSLSLYQFPSLWTKNWRYYSIPITVA